MSEEPFLPNYFSLEREVFNFGKVDLFLKKNHISDIANLSLLQYHRDSYRFLQSYVSYHLHVWN